MTALPQRPRRGGGGATRWAEVEDATAFGDQMTAIRWATPDEIARKLGTTGDSSLDDDSAPADRSLLRQAVDRRNDQLWSKPADYVLKNPRVAELHEAMTQAAAQPAIPPAVTSALQAAGAPALAASDEDRRAAIAAYANTTLAEQERLGVPEGHRQVLPEAEAQELATRILGEDIATADRTLRNLAADWSDAWPRVLEDMKRGGLPPAYADLAAMDNPVTRQLLAEVLTIQAKEPGALRTKLGVDSDSIDALVDRHRAEGLLTDDRSKLVKLVAYRHALFTESEEAVRRALAAVTNNAVVSPTQTSNSTTGIPQISGYSHPPSSPRGTLVFDRQGKPLIGANGKQVQVPTGWDFDFFYKAGYDDAREGVGAIFFRLMNALTPAAAESLTKFRHGGPWDLQRMGPLRPGELMIDDFRDGASIAIGRYAKGAGISLQDILEIQQAYAVLSRAKWSEHESRSILYYPLPERNVKNTEIGYNLPK